MLSKFQNAVNMAKALLKTGKTQCDDLANEEEPDCILEGLLLMIVNDQNLQVGLLQQGCHSLLPYKSNIPCFGLLSPVVDCSFVSIDPTNV